MAVILINRIFSKRTQSVYHLQLSTLSLKLPFGFMNCDAI